MSQYLSSVGKDFLAAANGCMVYWYVLTSIRLILTQFDGCEDCRKRLEVFF